MADDPLSLLNPKKQQPAMLLKGKKSGGRDSDPDKQAKKIKCFQTPPAKAHHARPVNHRSKRLWGRFSFVSYKKTVFSQQYSVESRTRLHLPCKTHL
jgi:hypothetical protein